MPSKIFYPKKHPDYDALAIVNKERRIYNPAHESPGNKYNNKSHPDFLSCPVCMVAMARCRRAKQTKPIQAENRTFQQIQTISLYNYANVFAGW